MLKLHRLFIAGLLAAIARKLDHMLQVHHADEYQEALQQQNIVLSIADRQQLIWEGVEATAGLVGGQLTRPAVQELLEEVTNLVESPTVVLGEFDPAFLSLPK